MSLRGYRPQSEFFRKHFDDGFKEGLLLAIKRFTEVVGISLSAEQREILERADVERLKAIYEVVLSSKQWPAVELEPEGLEELMSLHGHDLQSKVARKYAEQGYEEAYEEAYKKGYREGYKEGLLWAVEGLTEVLGISLSAEQRETLDEAEIERLEAICEALCSSKQWPAD